MTYEEIFNYSHGYQFKTYPIEGENFESMFIAYVRKFGGTNRKEMRHKYKRTDPNLLISRYLELIEHFYNYNLGSIYLQSSLVHYFKTNFWVSMLWSFEAAVEFECRKDPYDIIKVLDAKNKDYGNRNFEIYKDLGVLTRVVDKLGRLDTLLSTNRKPNFESIQDSYEDTFNYCLIALKMLGFTK